jgi:hypothetical protein
VLPERCPAVFVDDVGTGHRSWREIRRLVTGSPDNVRFLPLAPVTNRTMIWSDMLRRKKLRGDVDFAAIYAASIS